MNGIVLSKEGLSLNKPNDKTKSSEKLVESNKKSNDGDNTTHVMDRRVPSKNKLNKYNFKSKFQ